MARPDAPELETVAEYRARTLRERAAKARALRERFARASRPRWRWPRVVRRWARLVLAAYWIVCLGVLAAGAYTLYPGRFARAAWGLTAPLPLAAHADAAWEAVPAPMMRFPNCEAAHQAGVYDIPAGSAAYNPRQDGDGDGFACETYPDDPYAGRRRFAALR